MTQHDDRVGKEDRRDRYERKRGQSQTGASGDSHKRRDPYKRSYVDHGNDWENEEFEDEWLDDHN